MTSAQARGAWVEGYEAPIKRALWERILRLRRAARSGPPSGWSVVSMSGSWSWWAWGSRGCCVPAVVWMLGHGALMGLTLCDAAVG